MKCVTLHLCSQHCHVGTRHGVSAGVRLDMLTRLRFKNWRSLRDVTIDLSPITVFIGANSSGKTNIVDALRFLQYSHTVGNRGIVGAIKYKWGGAEKIQTVGAPKDEPTEIEFSIETQVGPTPLTKCISMLFYGSETPLLRYSRRFTYGSEAWEETNDLPPIPDASPVKSFWPEDQSDPTDRRFAVEQFIHTYFTRRWQLFKELFDPKLTLPPETDPGNLYVIEEHGRNIIFMLDNMRFERPDLYEKLLEDISWLLNYVEGVETKQTEHEFSLLLREKSYHGLQAPSISAGTARLIAFLTAFYALDMDRSRVESASGQQFEGLTIPVNEMPGLVVIEEPDTALNPGILRNFVEQLRYFTTGEHPRQVILTTHNPRFLDYFEPEEVRVVERDEQGYTAVHHLPDHIREIWLDKYTLGEVWMTRSLGGLPE